MNNKYPKSYYGRFDSKIKCNSGILNHINNINQINKLSRTGKRVSIGVIGHIDHGRTTLTTAIKIANQLPLNKIVMNPDEKTIEEIKLQNSSLPITIPNGYLDNILNFNCSTDNYNYDKESITRKKNKAKRKKKNKHSKRYNK